MWQLLDVQKNTGMLITESFAMWPGSSVSGMYFAHPESRYFSLGKIDRDQVADYSERKGMSLKSRTVARPQSELRSCQIAFSVCLRPIERDTCFIHLSNLQEKLPPVHPEKNEPEDQHDGKP